jgi:hypothetical protein
MWQLAVEHLFALQQAVTLYECYRKQLRLCDEQLQPFRRRYRFWRCCARLPALNDQKPYRRLNPARGRAARQLEGTGGRIVY